MDALNTTFEAFSNETLDSDETPFPWGYEDDEHYHDEEYNHEISFDEFIPKTTIEFILYYLTMANVTVVTPLISLLGIVGGIINMVIFKRQGFNDTVNIVLFATSASDSLTSLAGFLRKMFNNPMILERWGHQIPFYASGIFGEHLRRMALYVGFRFTALVTLERCLCIALPLKVKDIVNVRSVKAAVFVISMVTFLSAIPAYFLISYQHVYDTLPYDTNITLPGWETILDIMPIIVEMDMCMLFICYGIIILCSIILVAKLVEKSKWRQKTTATTNSEGVATVSQRDLKVVKMIIIVAVVFIVGSTPDIIMIYGNVEDGFEETAGYIILLGITYLGEAINASVNIFIYYNMSSKYKAVFRSMFCGESTSNQLKGT